jgi:hypothetical protein
LEDLYDGVWALSRDEVSETLLTNIDSEKRKISVIWSISGIESPLALTKRMKYKYNSQYFCQYAIPDIKENISSSSRRTTLKLLLLHLENASAHNSRLSSEKIESATAQRVAHRPCCPDGAPSDFFLYASLNGKLRETLFTANDDLTFAIGVMISEIPEMVRENVFTNSIMRPSCMMKKRGQD